MTKLNGFVILTALCILCCRECSGKLRDKFFNGPCSVGDFRCLNGNCISKKNFCNKINDCGDNSDESYCSGRSSCPTTYPFYRCIYAYRCIPEAWKCDGVDDCTGYGDDEKNCATSWDRNTVSIQRIAQARKQALDWVHRQARNDTSIVRWGTRVQKAALALFLSNESFYPFNGTGREMAYEMSIQLLSVFLLKKMDEVKTNQMSPYINSLLAVCIDPRKFHSVDLIKELRTRVDAQDYTNPFELLTLCNAGELLNEKDIEKLTTAFRTPRHQVWTETQAIAVLALACAGQQPRSSFSRNSLKDFTIALKQKQFRNGTVEDLKGTALVMQALFATELQEDEDNFDEERAMLQILRAQKDDGSFGNLVDTYYVIPLLSFKSLVNISSSHCPPVTKDEDEALVELINRPGPKIRVRYTLWIGDDKDVERSLQLNVPEKSSFYTMMEIARDIDHKYSFQYIVKQAPFPSVSKPKPYITAISGLSDDSETGKFWFPYFFNSTGNVWSVLEMSPADFILKENDHVAFWYKSGD